MITVDTQRAAVQRYCTEIGTDRLLVQAAGGNVSWKSGGTLWIKASGSWLASAERKEIFVPVDKHVLDAAIANSDYDVAPRVQIENPLRPSIETLLHAVMPHKLVLHLHPVEAVAHLIRQDCESSLRSALNDVITWGFVGYHKPGAELAKAVHHELLNNPDIQVVLLKNHGVIVGAENIEKIDKILQLLIRSLCVEPTLNKADVHNHPQIALDTLDRTPYRICPNPKLHALAFDAELYRRLNTSWAICPDHVVFLGAAALCIGNTGNLTATLMSRRSSPPFVFVENVGVLENRQATPAQKAQLTFYLDVMMRQRCEQRLETLSQDQIGELLNWDAEKYRASINHS